MEYGNKFTRFIYYSLPAPLKNCAVSLYDLKGQHKLYRDSYIEYYKQLEAMMYLSSSELEYIEIEKLKNLLGYAYREIPYYGALFKGLGIKPGNIHKLTDLQLLPILTKEMVRRHQDDLIPKGLPRDKLIHVTTSGTTGTPLHLYQTKECLQKEKASLALQYSCAGLRPNEKIAKIAGHPVISVHQQSPPFWVKNFFRNQLIMSSYHISDKTVKQYIGALEDYQPAVIHGYASSVYRIAIAINQYNLRSIRPKAVFIGSEILLPHQRREIEEAFRCKAFLRYGNAEKAGCIAECEQGGLHVFPGHSIIEFLDNSNQPVHSGRPGRVVCTNLDNCGMVLVRYDTGDIAVPASPDYECTCGRGGRVVKVIRGRQQDFIISRNGSSVGSAALSRLFYGLRNIVGSQFVQSNSGLLTIRLVTTEGFGQTDRSKLKRTAFDLLGLSPRIEVVASLERLPSGKIPYIIRTP